METAILAGQNRPASSGANARVRVLESGVIARQTGHGRRVEVRSVCCGKRVFDVRVSMEEGSIPAGTSSFPSLSLRDRVRGVSSGTRSVWQPDGSLLVETICRHCDRKVTGRVTAERGVPVPSSAGGLDGPWRCECGRSLGRIDAVRGRVKTSCPRCPAEVSIIASAAIAEESSPQADYPFTSPY